jgi:hypothetical protein
MPGMPSTKTFAAAVALCAGLALIPGPAEARFGKAGSNSGDSSSSDGGGNNNNSHDSSGGKVHAATPYDPNQAQPNPGAPVGRSRSHDYGSDPWYAWCWDDFRCMDRYGYWFGYSPYPSVVPPQQTPTPQEVTKQRSPALLSVRAEAHGYVEGGAGLGLSLGAEHGRLGLHSRLLGIFVGSEDGSGAIDSIKLMDLHLTYAVLADDRARVRLGAGMDSAFAPDIIMAGPGISLSGVVRIMGPISAEGMLKFTLYPYTQVDWSGGVSMAMGPLGMRVGWRRMYLNDNGHVDGVAHADVFSGPYIALALAL